MSDTRHRNEGPGGCVPWEEHARLLEAFAYEARVVEAQTLDVKALGKGRREILERQVNRMRAVALGREVPRRYVGGDWRESTDRRLQES